MHIKKLIMLDSKIKNINIEEYNYPLPEDKIAFHPKNEREQSKLLTYSQGKINDAIYNDLDNILSSEDVLIFNNTRVINARLWFQKPTGKIIELFCLEPKDQELELALSTTNKIVWRCMVGGAKRWKENPLKKEVVINGKPININASKGEYIKNAFEITFEWFDDEITFSEILEEIGKTPLPPYIKREDTITDEERYQTVYSITEGSVAAPTAGLHFSENLLDKIREKGVNTEFLTLHVGAGTFKPVTADLIGEHDMHFEVFEVSSDFIQTIINSLAKRIIPVGTTSSRTLESLYWIGARMAIQGTPSKKEILELTQWESYDLEKKNIPVLDALKTLLDYSSQINANIIGKTQLMIAPGYKFKIIKGLITNFHLPKSTLLLLVSALIGEDWKKVYDYALKNDYRFLSYGDGSFLIGC